MTCIGIVVKKGSAAARELSHKLVEWAQHRSLQMLFESHGVEGWRPKVDSTSADELVRRCEIVVTLGGDGTFLSVARHVTELSPILIGVNLGTLGFLTEVQTDELFETLESVLKSEVPLLTRELLQVIVERQGREVFRSQALNDVVIVKGARDKLIDLDVSIDTVELMRLRADGLIFATPAGSTAYSLAAGGSIAAPGLPVILMTPMMAHSLTARPLILSMNSLIRVTVPRYDGRIFLTADGQGGFDVVADDIIRINRSPHTITCVRSDKHNYFEIVRTKLNWGRANKN